MFAVIFTLNLTIVHEAANPITVIVNNNIVKFDVFPVIENGRTLVPVRAIFEALGAVVTWNANTRTAIGVKGTRTVNIKVDSTDATINGIHKKLDVPAKIIQNRTLVPLRFISESLGSIVSWNGETRTAKITDNNTQVQESTQTTNFNRISLDIPDGWIYSTNPEAASGTDQYNWRLH
ncbi:MAG TPA: copper amine oxidase N-terminal domain-containing protein [Pseudobacteroides sp.]|uniref:copper amine oxidase N-terminal domain-containing protein n=1 Tax=Pseudobacteroides sp. TaxID=1968840 RepID=UPI002F92698C